MNVLVSKSARRIALGLLLLLLLTPLMMARCSSGGSSGGGGGTPVDNDNGQTPTNNPPTADAGASRNVDVGASVTLDGSASSDPDGDPVTFSWEQKLGAGVTLSSTSETVVTFTAPSNGTALAFDLTVSDGQSSSTDAVSVFVRPVNPSVQVVELPQSPSVRDDPVVQGNLPPSYVVESPAEMPDLQREGGAYALFEETQFAPLAEVQLAPGATHEVDLQIAGPSVLLGSAKWIGTTELLRLTVSLDGTGLANGAGYTSGLDRGGAGLTVRTASGGLARLSVANTSSATVNVWMDFGALSLDLLE